jgi:hypothetical protein
MVGARRSSSAVTSSAAVNDGVPEQLNVATPRSRRARASLIKRTILPPETHAIADDAPLGGSHVKIVEMGGDREGAPSVAGLRARGFAPMRAHRASRAMPPEARRCGWSTR